MKKIEDRYKKLDEISHLLLRPSMYIGSIKTQTLKKYVLDDGKMIQKEITYSPGFLKLFDEIIMNSIDESKRIRTKLNIIKINIDLDTNNISIYDNGGMPVVKHKEYKEWIPELVFSSFRAGSNFNEDESRTWAGTNGVGSVITNVFSKKFKITTCDGKNKFSQTFSDNMGKRSKPSVSKSKKGHTEISYITDFEKFGMKKIDQYHLLIIQKRIIDIAGCNPKLKIYFNGDLFPIKTFEDYIKLYNSDVLFEENKQKTWSIGLCVSGEGFQQISFVNSIETYDGGSHVDYVLNQILSKVREHFKKKYKVDVKPSEIKNHLMFFLDAEVINPSFNSQTKEKLITESKDFGTEYIVSDKLIKSILDSEIVESILDWISRKKIADENKLARNLNKSLLKKKVDKLIDAKGKTRWKCSLGIFEGDSATSAFRKYRTPETMGAFALKGKFMNVTDISSDKFVNNAEVVNLMGAIGLKLGKEPELKNLRYGRILIYSDADVDGSSITALLINFFYRYWPKLFDMNMIYKVETPIVVASKKGSKTKSLFYTQDEYKSWLKKVNISNWEVKYKKGLAALVDDEYNEIINKPRLVRIDSTKKSEDYLDIWFGKDSDLRKKEMLK